MMISINRQAQSMATGINNLSFALENMVRNIRPGTDYSCGTALGSGGCGMNGNTDFTYINSNGETVTYSLVASTLQETVEKADNTTVVMILTDPSVTVASLMFYGYGLSPPVNYTQARVTVMVSGTVPSGPGKTQSFTVETGATMRGTDI